MNYMTMICDLKGSRFLINREDVQYRLIEALKSVNRAFSEYIVSPFLIIVGDEWQGLLHYPCDYQSILEAYHNALEGLPFYCGIGVGEITIHNFELTVNQLDGPSFHKARKALEIAKSNDFSLVYIQ